MSALLDDTEVPSPQHYVYDTIEVVKTGRTAHRKSQFAGKTLIIYEIIPADPESIQFKKWVTEDLLYTID